MASKGMEMGPAALVVLVALLALQGYGQSTSGCTNVLMTLTPCLNYVSGNSSTPSSTCCSTLSSVDQSQPQCLCLLLNGAAPSLGYNINKTLALGLPGACNVKMPSASLCNAISPSRAPTSPPADSSDDTPISPTSTSTPTIPSGSKTTPTVSGSTSAKIRGIELSLGSVLFALLVVSLAPNFFEC